jgi:polyisoprenoid-binding protein YceI
MEQPTKKSTWAIDPVHSTIRFEAKYLLITSVSGWFREFEGTVVSEHDDFSNSAIHFTIYTNSLDTGNEQRDRHLRSPDFFDTQKYPVIHFRSTAVVVRDKTIYVTGLLNVKDINQEYCFTASHLGTTSDPMGNTKAGFEMNTVLNRHDFKISWNQLYGVDALLLGNEVKLHADVQLLKLS